MLVFELRFFFLPAPARLRNRSAGVHMSIHCICILQHQVLHCLCGMRVIVDLLTWQLFLYMPVCVGRMRQYFIGIWSWKKGQGCLGRKGLLGSAWTDLYTTGIRLTKSPRPDGTHRQTQRGWLTLLLSIQVRLNSLLACCVSVTSQHVTHHTHVVFVVYYGWCLD